MVSVIKDYSTTNPNNTGARGRLGVKSDYKWIVVHYVGACNWNTGFESTAKNNCIYYRDNKVGASANFYVDSTGVYQSVPWNSDRYAWHCGTGTNTSAKYLVYDGADFCNNTNSLGVEICTCKMNPATRSAYDNDWYFNDKTYANAVEFIKQLMQEFGIDINHVIRHYDVNTIHKPCPSQFVGNSVKTYYGKTGEQNWQEFKAKLVSTPSPAPVPSPTVKDICQVYKVASDDGILNLREQPNNNGKLIIGMKTGNFVLGLKEQSDGWVYVRFLKGNDIVDGWCYGKYLAKAQTIENRRVKSPDGTLNIRCIPSTSGKLIATMGNNFAFGILQKINPAWGLIWCGQAIGYCNITNNYSYKC